MEGVTTVDLFCGVGGLTHGFIEEGFSVAAGYDADEACRYAYEENNPGASFFGKDLTSVSGEEIASHFPEGHVKVLMGCAPCQPFSSYSSTRKGSDDKWNLVRRFADLVAEVEPDIVSMENVTRLRSFDGGEVFGYFLDRLREIGHDTPFFENVYCPDYGVPQTRRRLVLLSSRYGEIELIPPTHEAPNRRSVWDQIGGLPEIAAGETSEADPYHKAAGLSDLNLERIRSSRPGGTWEDWDEELRAACHRKKSGQSYKSVYGRMQKDEPGPTITTQFYSFGRGRFGHPKQDRAISIREGALLQTFPPDYRFVPPEETIHFTSVGRHIGNAVPPALGSVVAKSIEAHLSTRG